MNVAVVILNWNGQELLAKFLPSVVKFSKEATVYVADNASTDNSVLFVTKNFPSIKIIQNKENGGYAKGYNDALKNLSEDIFVLLNSDVEVTGNWLRPVISEFEKDPSVVAVQPKILDFKNKEYFEYAGAAGGFIDKYGYPYCRGRIFNTLEKDTGQYDAVSEIFWASGACLFIKSEAFWQAGELDEDYFAHQEEIDLCWRLQSKGGKILSVGASKVYHVGGATLAVLNPKKTFYNFRNSLLNLFKNAKGVNTYCSIFVRMVLDAIAAIQFLIQGKPKHFLAIVKAHFSFYRMLPKFLQKRKKNASEITYFKIKSIVFQYFILKKKHFKQL
ncbi:glycosyltransferase family 2 protein [Aequorivita antarctica]|uniref:Glycosyltransferase family 2 protein n=1 Tax=Aequorivita antarctica TaxID=153266 RepID=A0A5C6YW81_9FLAO|nr:glycosyltransferase family 2 protein [Aequorivita antarctica]TXD71844.1 glycosyltransferase family 2 protein [Aequorivita antarctica]SRX75422.1 N-acetylglucosaminyl-diphospho-decaprenol L-rhamnosyltransferase [Aequorivita antarctica]